MQYLKKLYANPVVYATVWTVLQAGTAALAGYKTDNALVAAAVLIVVTAVSKAVREHLAK